MTTPEDIAEAIYTIAGTLRGVEWYGFGSFFKGATTYGDIDILAVCADDATAAHARRVLGDLCAKWPIHLVVMDQTEAEATGFVRTEGCVDIRKLWRANST